MHIRQRAEIFKALGHPARLAVAERLGLGEACVGDLQTLPELADLSGPTVSQHLLVLKKAGVVVDDKRGKRIFYRLRIPCVANIPLYAKDMLV